MRKAWIYAIVCITLLAAVGCNKQSAEKPLATSSYTSYEEAILGEAQARGIVLTEEELGKIARNADADTIEYLKAGVTLTEDQQKELLQSYKIEALAGKLRNLLIQSVSVPEADVRKWYDERLAALQKAFADDPGMFKGQQEGYELYGGVPPLVVPEGYIHVRHILVSDEETANQLLSRITQGESFDALLEEYGTDPGMLAEPYRTTGYLVGSYETQRDYLPEFKQAALALKNAGDISGVIKSEAGFHIIKMLDCLQAKTVPYEEVSGRIRTLLEKQAQQNAFEELVKGWYKEN